MTEISLLDLVTALDPPDPHPGLVAAQPVPAAEVMACSGGLFPARRVFVPAVPAT